MKTAREAVKAWRRPSTLVFCLLLGAAGVAARLLLADHYYFRLIHIPSHDLSQGLAFFATSMHSMRLTGDLAWWFPGSFSGYAQYYQGFFSPLAPTYGHIVFIAWAHLIAMLGTVGVRIPEYFQYLAFNFVVLPFLAFVAFSWFCSLILRSRSAVALAVMAYVLSGIGLWHSSWFFYQEAFSVFFLLAASLALLKAPSRPRMLMWLVAVMIQFASLNYWTVYNIFFVAIVLGSYLATHWNQAVRLVVRIRELRALHGRGTGLALAAFAVVMLAWTALIVSALHDQAANSVRYVYSPVQAMERVQEMRRFTTELFNPLLARALKHYPIINESHNARYIGVLLLPLIGIAAFASIGRRTRWLLSSSALVLAVCLATPPAVLAWMAIPTMDRVQHVFYFYSHYWQLLAVLLAAVGFDTLLAHHSARVRRVMLWLLGTAVALAAGVMGGLALVSERYPVGDVNLESNLRAATLVVLGCALLFRAVSSARPAERRLAAAALLWLMLIDLSAYFHNGSRADMVMTTRRPWIGMMPSEEQRSALREAWGEPRPEQGFTAGLDDYMPITNEFWPFNIFMVPRPLWVEAAQAYWRDTRSSPPLTFHDAVLPLQSQDSLPVSVAEDFKDFDKQLRVSGVPQAPHSGGTAAPSGAGDFAFRWNRWRYNEFEFEVTAPSDGWVRIRQLHDPQWRVTIDGVETATHKANYLNMAVPISRGTHVMRWRYNPLPRRIYWFAAALLEMTVAVFLTLAVLMARHPSPRFKVLHRRRSP